MDKNFYSDMRKDADVQTLSRETLEDWGNFLSILPRFSRIIDSLAKVILHICRNINKSSTNVVQIMYGGLQLYL